MLSVSAVFCGVECNDGAGGGVGSGTNGRGVDKDCDCAFGGDGGAGSFGLKTGNFNFGTCGFEIGAAVEVDDLTGNGRSRGGSGGSISGCFDLAFGGVSGAGSCGFGFGSVERFRDCVDAKIPARVCPATRNFSKDVGFGFPGMKVEVLEDGGADAARLFCEISGLFCSAFSRS